MAVLVPAFRNSLLRSLLPQPFLFVPPALTWSLPSLQSLLELFPPFVLAVPKSKTSHSRKAMRSANKGLKDKHNITSCPGCGSPKLAHHLCSNCYGSITKKWKAEKRGEANGSIHEMI
ncbi:uncharacterized protein LACBIDRAFT_300691 [Laccaria bicolor S238N-H82]|uniref:Large ribosomal subunit protein bL32m n=1 Tax=Laccaria bicolor (strain S238N-H82 / ATCC MYA-4686) TaxID=486041 RepID=B0CQ35_LACBS|nr:uncharacterized protein LACBIDRAFT_300691 [Laccaria bicolor S238N-H82]EDR15608.1 predicted protein [Laccaria bicolor S238N-H82]|eukprot:XP_001873816.1 predicted protein [Laccaria bicolor S238N-H82]